MLNAQSFYIGWQCKGGAFKMNPIRVVSTQNENLCVGNYTSDENKIRNWIKAKRTC